MTLDTVIYNPNHDIYAFITITFQYTINGVLSKNIEVTSFKMDYYSNNWSRLILEIIYIIIVIVKSNDCIKSWLYYWRLPEVSALVNI